MYFLSIVFVFTSFVMVNASENIEIAKNINPYEECSQLYEDVRDAAFEVTGDFILAISIAIRAEENCMEEVDHP